MERWRFGGERLTRSEAFDLVRRAVNELVTGDNSIRASEVRRHARQLLGRDSESLSDRMFVRILKDAHEQGIIDLRRRGDDFEVARAAEAAPVSEQVARHEKAAVAASAPRRLPRAATGMGRAWAWDTRCARARRGRPGAPPPELLSIGVVEDVPSARGRAEVKCSRQATTAPHRRNRRRRLADAAVAASAGEPHQRKRETVARRCGAAAGCRSAKPAAKAKRGRAAAKKGGGGDARGKKSAPAPTASMTKNAAPRARRSRLAPPLPPRIL